MNERIKLLAEQAGIPSLWTVGTDKQGNPILEKFAELIVQECLDQCYNRGMNDELYAGQLKAASFIEQHFGVEE